nr:AAA family ATPase [Cryobacterium sp. TMT1-21]
MRLSGDDRQLAAVESSEALRLLEREVGSVRLKEIRRFTSPAEAEATRPRWAPVPLVRGQQPGHRRQHRQDDRRRPRRLAARRRSRQEHRHVASSPSWYR